VLGSDPERQRFRLALVDGVRTVIKSGLGLLGVDAPEEM
jgi:arginyl-tRNA synthetase